jgi:hypothetical protein
MSAKIVTVQASRGNVATTHLAFADLPQQPLCRPVPGRFSQRFDTANCAPCAKEARRRCLDVDGLVRISSRVWSLVNAVKGHAQANYDTNAWDLVVEAYSDNELAEVVRGCRTATGAIAKVAKALEPYRERRAYHDAEITAATTGEVTVFSDPLQPEADLPAAKSVIEWSSGEDDWYGKETWPGKVGHNEHTPEGVTYVSGFRVTLEAPGFCDHKPGGWPDCRQDACRHPECVVPF